MRLFLLSTLLLASCGGGEERAPLANDAAAQQQAIENEARRLRDLAENQTSQIEQALENEGAIIFENRGNLLNQAANAADAAPAEGNSVN
jgi:hypothetical protein